MYFRLGQLMAMALLQGGASIRILSPGVFNYLSGMKPGDIIVGISECPDAAVRDLLRKVCKSVLTMCDVCSNYRYGSFLLLRMHCQFYAILC